MGTRRALTRTSFIACLALPSFTFAEEARLLEEVVVTATKRAESLQDVPISVSALSGADLEALNPRTASDIAAQVPNLVATSTMGDGIPIFSLRGISMSDYSLNQLSPVAIYVDEVYKGSPPLQGVQLYDLERIEVLRGPQGTLYGKNTTGGAVNFITARPSMETGGYVNLTAGNYGRFDAEGALDVALADETLGLRIAATRAVADGWLENRQPGIRDAEAVDEYGVRATLLWQPSDTLDVTLRAAGSQQEAVNYGIQPFNIGPDGVGAGLYGLYNLLGASTGVDYAREGVDFFAFDSDQDTERSVDSRSVALTVNWDLSDVLMLTSITSWDDGELYNPEDADGSPNLVLRIPYVGETEQLAQDLRLTSSLGGPYEFIAGVYYSRDDVYNRTTLGFWQDLDMNADGSLDFNDCLDPLYTVFGLGQATQAGADTEQVLNDFGLSLADFFPAGCQAQNDFDQVRDSMAGYFDAHADLGDRTTLRFGLRYTRDEIDLENFSARLLGNDFVPLLNTIPGDPDDPFATSPVDSRTDDELSGKLGVDFTLAGGAMVYASYSRGYRSGAFNAQAFFDPSELTSVDPETVNSFEIGMKAEFFDRSLQLNGAIFHYDYEDQQFLDVDASTAAQTLVNIDKSRVTGLEIELLAAPTANLVLRSGLGLLDTEVKQGTLGGVDLAGNELILAPEVNFNLLADWTALSTNAGSLHAVLDTTYTGSHYFEIYNLERMKQAAFWLVNGRLQFDSANERWALALWGKNLLEEEYRTSAIDLAAFGFDYSHIGTPRTYGAEVLFRF